MQTGVLRVLRATAASWWQHRELRRTGQTGQAQRLERQTVLHDLGYLRQAATVPDAHVICGEGGTFLHLGWITVSTLAPIERFPLTLPSNADPAAYGTYVQGWLRHSVGVDLGRNDPTALVVIRDECYPEFTGRGFEQRLGQRRRTVVHHEAVKMTDYMDIADFLVNRLTQIPHWDLAIDASGLGGPFSSTLPQAGVEHWAVTMTAGSSINIKGRTVNCSKNVLLENMAKGLETGELTIASDLPDRGLLDREIGSFELTSTSAGNLTLAGGGKGHHADRAIALALAYLKTTHLENRTMSFGKLQGYWG